MIGLIAKPWPKTLTSQSGVTVASGFPVINVLNNDYGRVLVTNDGQAVNAGLLMRFDLCAKLPVDVIALLWHNLPSTGRVNVYGSDAANLSSAELVIDSAPVKTGDSFRDLLVLRKTLYTLPSPKAYRYWQIEIYPPSGGNLSNCSLSRVFIGLGAKFVIGFQKAVLSAKDMNAKVTTEVGEDRSQEDSRLIRPVISLSLEYAKQSEMEQVLGQYTLGLGVSKPLLVCTDLTTPTLQDNVAFGRPDKVIALESSIYDVWSFEAVVTSLGV